MTAAATHWLIRYTSPDGRISMIVAGSRAIAEDIATRLHDATLLETNGLAEARALASVLDVPAEIERIKETTK